MKLGILCTMINGFGRRGYYNSQEVGLGRALAAMGHELTIYKGIDPSEEEEKVVVVPGLVVWYLRLCGIWEPTAGCPSPRWMQRRRHCSALATSSFFCPTSTAGAKDTGRHSYPTSARHTA